jgi:hypothetical protein
MKDLYFCNPVFNPEPYIYEAIEIEGYVPDTSDLALFDQNGYDLTELERKYYVHFDRVPSEHRNKYHYSLRKPWYLQYPMEEKEALECIEKGEDPFSPEKRIMKKNKGAVLNHALILERKGYSGKALEQLKKWSITNPMVNKLIKLRPKWGIDFSIDYVGEGGEAFEVFHYEWDSFDYNEAEQAKIKLENMIKEVDWDAAALDLLKRRHEWSDLDFFKQSDWKCEYFGLPPEKFKMVAWDS